MGKVGVNGYHADIAIAQIPFIAGRGGIGAVELTGEPPIGAALRIDALFKTVQPAGFGLMTNSDAFDLFFLQAWNIHVEGHMLGKIVGEAVVDNVSYIGDGRVEIGLRIVVEQRETDGLQTHSRCFKHATHSSAVEHIDGAVASVVDSAQYQVGSAWAEVLIGQFHAVDRGPVASIDVEVT